MIDAGKACHAFHHANVRELNTARIQVDELWSFVYAKDRIAPFAKKPPASGAGSLWTWTALDAEAKLLLSWVVGNRETEFAFALMDDIRQRVSRRVQITSDGLHAYLVAAQSVFGRNVDFSQTIKQHVDEDGVVHPPERRPGIGNPDMELANTSLMERFNLTIRQEVKRYGRKTLGYSKRVENHVHELALFITHYNWCRKHSTLKTTPAVAAGLASERRDLDWLVGLVEARDSKPGPRGPYKKRRRGPGGDDGGSDDGAGVQVVEVQDVDSTPEDAGGYGEVDGGGDDEQVVYEGLE